MNGPVREVPMNWYMDGFSQPSTALLPWTDDPEGDVDRVLQILGPRPGARILDLACGGGRHTVELASRGFEMVGVDVSSCQLEIGVAGLEDQEGWMRFRLEYLEADLRDLECEAEFDVVLNLNGGAVGYFENDLENRRTFETISRSLRRGGRTLMQLPNVGYAESRLPARTWTEGRWTIELLERHWNPDERYVEGTMTPISSKIRPRWNQSRFASASTRSRSCSSSSARWACRWRRYSTRRAIQARRPRTSRRSSSSRAGTDPTEPREAQVT
jgi:SAM-dependent methyltransferase